MATQVVSASVAEARNSESDTEIPTTHTDRCHSECIPEFRKFSVDDDIVIYLGLFEKHGSNGLDRYKWKIQLLPLLTPQQCEVVQKI